MTQQSPDRSMTRLWHDPAISVWSIVTHPAIAPLPFTRLPDHRTMGEHGTNYLDVPTMDVPTVLGAIADVMSAHYAPTPYTEQCVVCGVSVLVLAPSDQHRAICRGCVTGPVTA